MKILQVTNAFPTASMPVYGIFIREQIESLKLIGMDSDIYFINGREKGKKEYLNAVFRLKKLMNNYDLIHCHHFITAAIVLALKPKPKVIVSFLSDGIKEFINPDFPLFNKMVKENIYKFIINKSSARIFKKAIPEFLLEDAFSFYLPNGVNTDIFKPVNKIKAKEYLGLNPNKTYLLYTSLIDLNRREKRYDIFKETINLLKNKYKRQDIEELVMTEVERDKVPFYFNSAALHLLTSDFEGSPNTVKESLACNTPVVSTNVGNVREMLKGLNSCFVSDSNNPEALAELVIKALNSTGKDNLRQVVLDKELDMNSVAVKLKDIYMKLYYAQV
ncbi:MAG: glycosyltransferase [Bacteroidales bacterium]|nr:glycosyltransferase [Bacteroidales bacterium]